MMMMMAVDGNLVVVMMTVRVVTGGDTHARVLAQRPVALL